MYKGLIENYRKFMPVGDEHRIISLCEGNTPLIRAYGLEKLMPGLEIYLKYEGLNPTGSFKDRGMTMAVTHAYNQGKKAVICASTGNTSASAAAYAARAGMKAYVLIPDGKIALGKLAQAVAYGAEVIPISGNFDEALEWVQDIASKLPIEIVNSINPYRLEGQKSAAFEVCDALGAAPDHLIIPVGNAGNITAYWKGFNEYFDKGFSSNKPMMRGFQAEGAAPIVKGEIVKQPETIATAIRIGNPASWNGALSAISESKGSIDAISDAEILKGYALLAKTEGIFAEPASCITISGLMKQYNSGLIHSGKVVCILTGNGLKDPDSALRDVSLSSVVSKVSEINEKIERGLLK